MNDREAIFSDRHGEVCSCHLQYEPSPPFQFWIDGVPRYYTPDFRCQKSGLFYEVVGTRQAFSKNRAKIEAFERHYPGQLSVVSPDGTLYRRRESIGIPRLRPREGYEIRKFVQDRLNLEKLPHLAKAKWLAGHIERGHLSPAILKFAGLRRKPVKSEIEPLYQ